MDTPSNCETSQPRHDGGAHRRTVVHSGPDRRIDTCRRLLMQEQIIDRTFCRWVSANAELAMLLELYAAAKDAREVYLWQLCNAVRIPSATAHRKLVRLTGLGLTVRTPLEGDRRRVGLQLTPAGIIAIDALLDRLAI